MDTEMCRLHVDQHVDVSEHGVYPKMAILVKNMMINDEVYPPFSSTKPMYVFRFTASNQFESPLLNQQ